MRAGGGVSTYVSDFFAEEYKLDYLIRRYAKPVVTWMHGITMGGGVGVGSGARHRVVTETAVLAMPEVTIGLFPDVGGSWFLGRLPGRVGLYLGLTGARLSAADAVFAGLADVPLQNASRHSVFNALLCTTWSDDTAANHASVRRILLAAAAWELAVDSSLRNRFHDLSRICAQPNLVECIASIHEFARRDEWAAAHSLTLTHGSPTSIALTWELQHRLRHASLAQCLELEYAAGLGCAETDFAEGIRALIIDKDRRPRWRHSSVQAVTRAFIDDLLRPRPPGLNLFAAPSLEGA
jgi:enoyl-CoA hydratase/carnithine racemase